MESTNNKHRGVELEAELKKSIEMRDAIAKMYGARRHELFYLFTALADSQNSVLHLQEELRKEGLCNEARANILQLREDVLHWAACGLMLPEDGEYFKSFMGEGIPCSYDYSKYWLRRNGNLMKFGMDDLTEVDPDWDHLRADTNAEGSGLL